MKSFKTLVLTGLLALGVAMLSITSFAANEEDYPKPLLYQMPDSTDDGGSGDSSGGGVINPGPGH